MQAGRDEDGFDPAHVDAEVAVVRHAVDRGDRDGRGDDADGHADDEEQRLTRDEPQHVLGHVRPGRGEAVELEGRVVDLVDVPQRVVSVQAAVHEERHEVEDDDPDAQLQQERCAGDGVSHRSEREASEHRPEEEDRHGGGADRHPVPGDVGCEVSPWLGQLPEAKRWQSFEATDEEVDAAEDGDGG